MNTHRNYETITIKPVSTICNLQCAYCYNASPIKYRKKLGCMSIDNLKSIFYSLQGINNKTIRLIWHGGEPMLAGLEFYELVVQLERELSSKRSDLTFLNSIQTNGTLITTEWARFFLRNDWTIGISFDGLPEIHDRYRKDHNNIGTYDLVKKGINTLQNEGVNFGVIVVVTSDLARSDFKDVYSSILSVTDRFEFSPCWEKPIDGIYKEYVVSPSDYLAFLIGIFESWWKKDSDHIRIRIFDNLVKSLRSSTSIKCAGLGECFQFVAIDSEGNVYPCDKFLGISEFYLGNINETTINSIYTSKRYFELLDISNTLPVECKQCLWCTKCLNGCSFDRYVGGDIFLQKTPFCETWKGMFEYLSNRNLDSDGKRLSIMNS